MTPSKALFYFCISFVVGITLQSFLKIPQEALWGFLLLAILSIGASVFSKKWQDHEKRVEGLRGVLNEFERYTVPLIRIESVDQLIDRGKDYIRRFKNQAGVALNISLLPLMEKYIADLEKDINSVWYKILKRINRVQ